MMVFRVVTLCRTMSFFYLQGDKFGSGGYVSDWNEEMC